MPEPSPTVYSWYTPEMAQEVEWLRDRYPSEVYKQNYDPGLDTYHKELMQKIRGRHLLDVFTMKSLDRLDHYHEYYCNGSSEAIFHLLARHKTHFPQVPLYQFEGEYQGYGEYAKALGLQFIDVPFGQSVSRLQPGVFFLSHPSAIDGNNVGLDVIEKITEYHYVVLDLAYCGMTAVQDFFAINNRVAAVVASMSKPFGLYYYRIGFLWARDPVPSLYGNKWFKNIWSIAVGEHVLNFWTASELEKRYRSWQTKACDEASNALGIRVEPSDVWILGHYYPNTQDALPASIRPFKRGLAYRFCLTPYFMEYANERA